MRLRVRMCVFACVCTCICVCHPKILVLSCATPYHECQCQVVEHDACYDNVEGAHGQRARNPFGQSECLQA